MKKIILIIAVLLYIHPILNAQTFWQSLGRPADSPSVTSELPRHDQMLQFNSKGYIYFLAESGQLFLSTDEGGIWRHLYVNTSLFDNFTTLKIIKNDRIIGVNWDGQIYNSDDDGQHWYVSGTFRDSLGNVIPCYRFATCQNGDLLVETFGDGVHKSTDNGSTWSLEAVVVSVGGINVRNDGVVFASSEDSFYSSTDNGSTWQVISKIPGANSSSQASVTCISFTKGNDLFIGDLVYSIPIDLNQGIWMSSDNGKTWIPRNSGIETQAVWSIVTDSTGTMWVGTDSGGVFHSTDGGSSWTQKNDGIINPISVDVFLGPDSYLYAVTPKGYVFRSNNKITVVTKDMNTIPDHFTLSQNYPNPFNPSVGAGR
jgi:photosystem II stability/assembly factor-like uncharacterized protein